MDLRELLSIPYLLEAEAVETEPGQWLIRLAYPELPGCAAEGFVVEDALELERRRIEIIVGLSRRVSSRRFRASRLPHPIRSGLPAISDCRRASPRCWPRIGLKRST